MSLKLISTIFLLLSVESESTPVKIDNSAMGTKFLNMFGYMSNTTMEMEPGKEKDDKMESAIMMYQEYNHLQPTGRLDDRTMRMMEMPRCGNDDKAVVDQMNKQTRTKRDTTTTDTKWEKGVVTYRFKNYAQCCLTPEEIQKEFELAVKIWLGALSTQNLNILKEDNEENPVDIDIEFVKGPHHDNMSFAEMNTIAHAFYPVQEGSHPIRGDIHFNDEERWISGSGKKGQRFLQTACHELGHSLGLVHSMAHKAVMHPTFPIEDKQEVDLYQDDVQRIQGLYGPPEEAELTLDVDPTFLQPSTQISSRSAVIGRLEKGDVDLLEPSGSSSVWEAVYPPRVGFEPAPDFEPDMGTFDEKADVNNEHQEAACRRLMVSPIHTDQSSFHCLQFLWKQFYYRQGQYQVRFAKLHKTG